ATRRGGRATGGGRGPCWSSSTCVDFKPRTVVKPRVSGVLAGISGKGCAWTCCGRKRCALRCPRTGRHAGTSVADHAAGRGGPMRITDRLKVEHGVYLQQLRTLQELLALKAPRPVLAAVVDTIASSEERHAEIEERALYPALINALGPQFPALAAVARDHAA